MAFIRHRSWFQLSNLTLMDIILITYDILLCDPAHQIKNEPGLSHHMVTVWGTFCRETMLEFLEGSSEKKFVVLIRPSKLTRARSVSESTIEGTLFRVSGCLAVSNDSLAEHILFLSPGRNHRHADGYYT